MACPDCGASLEDDFGLVECGSCGAQVLVGETAESQGEKTVESNINVHYNSEPSEGATDLNLEAFGSVDEDDLLESSVVSSLDGDTDSLAAEAPTEEIYEDENSAPDNLPDFMADEGGGDEEEVYSEGSDYEVPENPLGDIESFANEELAVEGALVYDLVIHGIDTPEIRNSIVGILKDPKFQWDIEELVASIKLGVLNIYSLNPVKAYLVITQARRLPIKLAWTQRSLV